MATKNTYFFPLEYSNCNLNNDFVFIKRKVNSIKRKVNFEKNNTTVSSHRHQSENLKISRSHALKSTAQNSINNLVSTQNLDINQIGNEMLRQEYVKVTRGEFGEHSYRMLISRLKKIFPYFENKVINQINNKEIYEFYEYLRSLNYSSITISQYIIALRKIFSYALSKEYILKIPLFPKVKNLSIPRGSFSLSEYLVLLRNAKKLAKVPKTISTPTHRDKRNGIYTEFHQIPHEFAWLIGFMVNSFIRPVDVKMIQHQHIQIIRGDRVYLRITLPETKKHTAQIVTLSPAVRIYEALLKYMKVRGCAQPNDYLFLPHIRDREAAIHILGKQFRYLLDYTKIREGIHGQNRTLYSLRHTAITFRLLYGRGIDLLTLARNARTSVEMIERFYTSNLSAEMNIDLLQSRRKNHTIQK